jgi:hypothetical protein
MGKRYEQLQDDQIGFIAEQQMFFVATAAPAGGHVNLSPKGMDSLRVLTPNRILWANATGSGNETAAHLAADPRITLMWCGFAKRPLILRAYGTAVTHHFDSPDFAALAAQLPPLPGLRQIVDVQISLTQSSCGYAVPFMEPAGERPTLRTWAETKGPEGLRAYWAERNAETIDGIPTGIEANL